MSGGKVPNRGKLEGKGRMLRGSQEQWGCRCGWSKMVRAEREREDVREELGTDPGSSARLLLWDPLLPHCLAAKGSQLNGSLGGVLNQGELSHPNHVPPWAHP